MTPEEAAGQKNTYAELLKANTIAYPNPVKYQPVLPIDEEVVNFDTLRDEWLPVSTLAERPIVKHAAKPPIYDVALFTRKVYDEDVLIEPSVKGYVDADDASDTEDSSVGDFEEGGD